MKYRRRLSPPRKVAIVICALILCHGYRNWFLMGNVDGTFVPNYTETLYPIAPGRTEQLVLYYDNTYESGYYGSGKYRIKFGLLSSEIILESSEEDGISSTEMSLKRSVLGKTRIIINYDLELFLYEKS